MTEDEAKTKGCCGPAHAGDRAPAETRIRLVSFLDMLRKNAMAFVNLGNRLEGARLVLDMGEELEAESREGFHADLVAIATLCDQLELPVSTQLVGNAARDIPQTGRELQVVINAIDAELASRIFLFVPSERAQHYEPQAVLQPQGAQSFPSAERELKVASTCYATDLPTACVYHSMRALEHGLRALAEDVGETFTVQMWGGGGTSSRRFRRGSLGGNRTVSPAWTRPRRTLDCCSFPKPPSNSHTSRTVGGTTPCTPRVSTATTRL